MVLTSIIPDDILGSNWTSLIPLGIFFIILGVIMVVINQMRTRAEEQELEQYVQQRLGKSISGAPLVRSPADNAETEKQNLISTLENENEMSNEKAVKNGKKAKKKQPVWRKEGTIYHLTCDYGDYQSKTNYLRCQRL